MVSGSLSVELDRLLLGASIDHDDEVILQQLIAPRIELGYLTYTGNCTNTFILLLFQHPSIQILKLFIYTLDNNAELQLPHSNTSLLKLTIFSNLLRPLAGLIMNSTSLNCLGITKPIQDSDLPVLTNIVQSHRSLKELRITNTAGDDASDNMLQLIETASTCRQLKKFMYQT